MNAGTLRQPDSLAQWADEAISRGYVVQVEASYYEVIAGDRVDIGLAVGSFDGRPYFRFSGFSGCLSQVPWTRLVSNVSERAMILIAETPEGVFAVKFRQEDILGQGEQFMQEILASKYIDVLDASQACVNSIRAQKAGGSTDSLGMIFVEVNW